MPDIIHLLPDAVANQIAAGEGSAAASLGGKGVGGERA